MKILMMKTTISKKDCRILLFTTAVGLLLLLSLHVGYGFSFHRGYDNHREMKRKVLSLQPLGVSTPSVDSSAGSGESTSSSTSPQLEQQGSTTTITTTTTTTTTTPSSIQRKYQTFLWKYNMEEYDINYRVEGPIDGPPILLIHGFGGSINHYRHQFPTFTNEGCRVYAVDLLGFGFSPKPSDVDYSFDLYVQLVSDFIRTMTTTATTTNINDKDKLDENHKWVVAGNSIGGLVSLGVAEKLGTKLVRGVVLFNCAGGMTGFRYTDVPVYIRPVLWFFQKVLLGPQVMGSSFFSRFSTKENVESILRQQGVYRNQTNVDSELLEILLQPASDDGAETVFLKTFAGTKASTIVRMKVLSLVQPVNNLPSQMLSTVFLGTALTHKGDPGPTPEQILPNLDVSVLAIWGDEDPWTPHDRGMHPPTNFHSYCDDFELHLIKNCGHCPHDEAPEQVNELVLTWMKGLGTRRKKTE
jgi:pimeloyl-ACP methyl ester carboxylesterase